MILSAPALLNLGGEERVLNTPKYGNERLCSLQVRGGVAAWFMLDSSLMMDMGTSIDGSSQTQKPITNIFSGRWGSDISPD